MVKYAVIVDPVGNGKFLPDEFSSRGIKSIAILSRAVPRDLQCGYAPEKFEEVINFDGNFDKIVTFLEKFSPLCVMIGHEIGIELGDSLAHRLGLPGNNPATSLERRDKFSMHARLQEANIRSMRQARITSVEAAQKWARSENSWPLVVKPSDSTASDDVYICTNVEQVIDNVGKILNSVNMLGGTNTSVVLQEFLEGREWVVDTVSCEGHHVVTNVSRYSKSILADGSIVYRHAEFLCPSNLEYAELIEYALNVNDALGVSYGAAHLEIIVTDKGPTLVEINARMHGCDAVKALQWCYPITQVDLSVDAFIDSDAFERKSHIELKNKKYMLALYLVAKNSGTVTNVISLEKLMQIKSYKMHSLPSSGKRVRKTVSLMTSPGNIWLLSDNADALWEDEHKIMEMISKGELLSITAD